MELSTMKIGDTIKYHNLFNGVESPVVMTLVHLASDGKVRRGEFSVSVLGLGVGSVSASESGDRTTWQGVVL